MRVMLANKQKPYYCPEHHLRKYRGYIHRKQVILLREVCLQSVGGILRAALRIHSVEARHASHLREMRHRNFGAPVQPWITLNQSGIDSPAVQPSYNGAELVVQAGVNIVGINGFAITAEDASESFDEPLSKMQVLAILKPFLA